MLQLGSHLFMQTTHDRIGLLIGHEVPKGRATQKSGLIVSGHERVWLRWRDHRANAISATLCVSEQRKKPHQKAASVVSATHPMEKRDGILLEDLNFAQGFGAVLVAVAVVLTGCGLGHADGDQGHEAGARHKKTVEHAELTSLGSG